MKCGCLSLVRLLLSFGIHAVVPLKRQIAYQLCWFNSCQSLVLRPCMKDSNALIISALGTIPAILCNFGFWLLSEGFQCLDWFDPYQFVGQFVVLGTCVQDSNVLIVGIAGSIPADSQVQLRAGTNWGCP